MCDRFQLHLDDGDAVYEEGHVGADRPASRDGELIDGVEAVVLRVFEVDEVGVDRLRAVVLLVDGVFLARGQDLVKGLVAVKQVVVVEVAAEGVQKPVDVVLGEFVVDVDDGFGEEVPVDYFRALAGSKAPGPTVASRCRIDIVPVQLSSPDRTPG